MKNIYLTMYCYYLQQTYGIVALDITPDAPYVTKAWEYFDKAAPFATINVHQLDCTLAPNQLPQFPGFPPSEYKNKLRPEKIIYLICVGSLI